MTPKTTNTTMNPPFSADSMSERGPADLTAQWQEARLVYPIYAALATQFDLAPLPYAAGELPPEKPSREAFDGDLKWLTALDEKVLAYQIRQLPSQILNGSEQALRALIHRQLRKVDKTNADRDKIDLLLVQYFVMCAAVDLLHKEIALSDVARVLGPVLVEADATPLEWCEPLDKILEKTKECHSLRDLMEDGLVEQGRMLKDAAEEDIGAQQVPEVPTSLLHGLENLGMAQVRIVERRNLRPLLGQEIDLLVIEPAVLLGLTVEKCPRIGGGE